MRLLSLELKPSNFPEIQATMKIKSVELRKDAEVILPEFNII
jgi:hypothetical protein